MVVDPPTTITVPSSTARRFKLCRIGGRSYADVLEDFMDAVPPRTFLEWAEHELSGPAVEYATVRGRLGFRAR